MKDFFRNRATSGGRRSKEGLPSDELSDRRRGSSSPSSWRARSGSPSQQPWRTSTLESGSKGPAGRLSPWRQHRNSDDTASSSSLGRDEDMSDVSSLRSAFLKSVHLDRERRISELKNRQSDDDDERETRLERVLRESSERRRSKLENQIPSSSFLDGEEEKRERPSWRDASSFRNRSGAKDYRERKAARAAAAAAAGEQQESRGKARLPWQSGAGHQTTRIRRQQSGRRENTFSQTMDSFRAEPIRSKSKDRGSQRSRVVEEVDGKAVTLPNRRNVTVSEFSAFLRVKTDILEQTLQFLGEDTRSEGYRIDIDVMELVALELGFDPVRDTRRDRTSSSELDYTERRLRRVGSDEAMAGRLDLGAEEKEEMYDAFPSRPPVVMLAGHVDHGKTTLMDALRKKSREAAAGGGGGKAKGDVKGKKIKAKKGKSSNDAEGGDVAGTEAGGITQVISAFQVSLPQQQQEETAGTSAGAVTFLDTPGHAAFKSMRESGTNAADVIVLVVAADDGVSRQTVEVLDFYKSVVRGNSGGSSGGLSLVVAMTKIDKHGIDVDEATMRIENQLLEHDIVTEGVASTAGGGGNEYGAVQLLPVSGMTGEGLDDLIEGLVLQSQIMDLRADVECRAEGIVMDARVEKGLGVVADCIVRWGTLERGDFVLSGVHGGKVKFLNDVNGRTIKKGEPSQPVRIIGFNSLPKAGDPIVCVTSEEIGKNIIARREAMSSTSAANSSHRADDSLGGADELELQVTGMESKQGATLQQVRDKYGFDGDGDDNGTIRIPVVLKADADGTLDAVREALISVGSESTRDLVVDPVALSIGPVTPTDVRMASESGAAIFTFSVPTDAAAATIAESEGVDIRSHDIIYALLDDAKEAFASHFPPVPVDKVHGRAIVQAVFDVNNKRNAEKIAGLKVQEGSLYKDDAPQTDDKNGGSLACYYRVLRDGKLVSPEEEELRAGSLRRVKENVDDVRRGDECGLGLSGYADFEVGDVIECYSTEMKYVFV